MDAERRCACLTGACTRPFPTSRGRISASQSTPANLPQHFCCSASQPRTKQHKPRACRRYPANVPQLKSSLSAVFLALQILALGVVARSIRFTDR